MDSESIIERIVFIVLIVYVVVAIWTGMGDDGLNFVVLLMMSLLLL